MKITSMFTPKILAKKLGVTEQTVNSWKKEGLPTVRIGKFSYIIEESFLKWAKSRESVQDASGQDKTSPGYDAMDP